MLIVFIICFMSFLTACSNRDTAYSPKYKLSECQISIYEHNNANNLVEFSKKYELLDSTIFFDTQLVDEQLMDAWIDRVITLNSILSTHEAKKVNNIYISDKLIANCWIGENGEKNTSFPLSISDEEVLAWILQVQFDSSYSLPYGVFAGVSSLWLEKEDYFKFTLSSIENADFLTELQFPIYESDNLPEKQRTYAWSFSYNLVDAWVRSGKDEKELMSMTIQELSEYLTEQYDIALPEYSFSPYSSKYEYCIKQGCFTYYVNKEYNDLILPKSKFNTSYDFLSDWLKDNAKNTYDANKEFGIGSMYPITVYLYDGLESIGTTGTASGDYIQVYSVGSFSHLYIYHILVKKGKAGYLKDIICELQANTSKYSKMMWYFLFSGEATHYPYDESVNEKQSYADTFLLYNRKSAFEANCDNFNFWLFADCFSALNTKRGQKFVSRLQLDSIQNYIAKKYGDEYVWQLNMDDELLIDEKTYSEIVEEWIDFVNTLK